LQWFFPDPMSMIEAPEPSLVPAMVEAILHRHPADAGVVPHGRVKYEKEDGGRLRDALPKNRVHLMVVESKHFANEIQERLQRPPAARLHARRDQNPDFRTGFTPSGTAAQTRDTPPVV
jgi:hypothetical protein